VQFLLTHFASKSSSSLKSVGKMFVTHLRNDFYELLVGSVIWLLLFNMLAVILLMAILS